MSDSDNKNDESTHEEEGKKEAHLSPLMQAVIKGDDDLVQNLLTSENDSAPSRFSHVNVQSTKGDTVLHLACIHKRYHCVRLLLEHNSDIRIQNNASETALGIAIKQGNTDIVKLFIDKKAHLVEDKSLSGSYLGLAVFHREHEILKLLLKNGSDIRNISDNYCPLHVAAAICDSKTCKILLEAGINVNKRDATGTTPLILAVRSRNLELVQIFVKFGSLVNMKDRIFSLSPLHYASQLGIIEVIKFLLWNDADINILDKQSMTPLTKAIVTREECAAIYLIKENCNFNIQYLDVHIQYRHPFDMALGLHMYNLCKFLILAGCNVPEKSMETLKTSNRKHSNDLLAWINDKLKNPDSLKHCCRLAVRRYVRSPFMQKSSRTDLPVIIQEYLVFPEVCINEVTAPPSPDNVNPRMSSDFDDFWYNP